MTEKCEAPKKAVLFWHAEKGTWMAEGPTDAGVKVVELKYGAVSSSGALFQLKQSLGPGWEVEIDHVRKS